MARRRSAEWTISHTNASSTVFWSTHFDHDDRSAADALRTPAEGN